MSIYILLKGIIIGFCVAVPIGPIGILCIQRSLSQGALYGIVFGLGVATADALYGSIAAFGISFISNFILQKEAIIKLLGGLFLLFVGCGKILKENSLKTPPIKKANLFNDYTSGFFITLTNPITIIIFATILSWPFVNIDISEISILPALLLVQGIFIGSALWFSILSILVGFLRTKFSRRYLKSINIISGTIIIAFGLFSLLSLLIK